MDTRRSLHILRRVGVIALVLALVVPSASLGAVSGSPDLSVYATDNRVSPGESTSLQISVVNAGDIEFGSLQNPTLNQEVTTARDTAVTVRSGDAPVEVQSGTAALGSVPRGAASTQIELSVDEGADPGTYRLPVRIRYTYTSSISDSGYHFEDRGGINTYLKIKVVEDAQFEVVSVDTDAAVGGNGQVAVTLRNDGAAAAEDTTVSLASTSADLSFGPTGTAETFVGDWETGETRMVTVGASVAGDATVRRLPLSATVSWTDSDGDQATETQRTGVVPEAESRLVEGNVSTTAAPGDSGEVTVQLTNGGSRTLHDATVSLSSSNGALTFGGAPSASTFVGDWAPGESRSVSVEAAFAAGVERRAYPVDVSASFTSADGRQGRTSPVTLGVEPAAEQSFDVAGPEATLRVGAEGTLSGSLVNQGPDTVENAVLVLRETGNNVDAVETEYALGDLAAGDQAQFSFDMDVSSSARDGPRQFSYEVEYEGDDGSTLTSDPLFVRGVVAPARDTFDVDVQQSTFSAGSSGRFTMEVTNAGNETVSDVSAKLFADSPVSANDDEAFVDELGPGESATVSFGVSIAGSATPKTYPVSLDFQYTEPDGDTKLSDTYRLPVTVEESGGGGLLFLGGGTAAGVGVAALALVAIGGVLRVR
ncbi:COG1361 S-layer family protein [Halorarius halobius]|uniref:COG1361 S-layer family protein n=1 Tax=Halorarius halobius TaxID=2962671 RepID=UPI0020CD569B|nr:CARDB domain-containing protein [Halorarius halobius]